MTATTSAPVSYPDRFFIGGQWVAPSSDATIDVIDAGTEELFFSVAAARAEDMSRAVGAARAAFDEGPWPAMTHAERAGYLRALGAAVQERSDGMAELWPRESGTTHLVAQYAAMMCAGAMESYAALADTFPFEELRAAVDGRRVRAVGPRARRRGRRHHPLERAARSSSRTRSGRRCWPAARWC